MKLTPEALFGRTPIAPSTPSSLEVSPDGRFGSYLRRADDDRERLELWLVDMASAKTWRLLSGNETAAEESTEEEDAERERRRMFAHGVTAYEWHPDGDHILIPAGGAAFLVSVADGALRRVTPLNTRQSGFRLSPKGTFLSFVRDTDLFVLCLADGAETRLTHDGGGGTVSNGLAEFIAQEEMARFDGHWWAPDERTLAFARVDLAAIPEIHRHEVDARGIRVVPQRYPHAGGPNAEVRLGMIATAGGEPRWLDWALAEDDYLARVDFAPDGALHVQAQSRDQKRLALRRFADGEWREVLTETSATWVNLHNNLRLLERGRKLWTSEREDSAQLYMADAVDERVYCRQRVFNAVDTGLRRVGRVLDANADCAWLEGSGDDPTYRLIARVPLSGVRREPRVLPSNQPEGWLFGAANAKTDRCLIAQSAPTQPSALFVFNEAGERRRVATPIPHRVIDVPAEASFGTIESGQFPLHYRLTKPTPFNPYKRHPVVVHVYGGPGAQRVRKEFPPLTVQLFAQAGFGVFELDNRGSANREKPFEDAIHRRLGHVEVADQLAGVEFLRTRNWVDAERIGIFGHSYGGYMVLMCLASSHAFAAGVSVAPVTDWTLYDTHYTERYLGTPEDNPQGYHESAVLPRVPNIDAPLLLMHGMADDNVLFTHTTALMQALQDAGKPFELMTYPGAKHAMQDSKVAIHRHHCILNFLRRTLAPTD